MRTDTSSIDEKVRRVREGGGLVESPGLVGARLEGARRTASVADVEIPSESQLRWRAQQEDLNQRAAEVDAEREWRARVREVVSQVSHPRYRYEVLDEGPCCDLRVVCDEAEDTHSPGEQTSWRGRRWRLSRHMLPGEIVQTAFLATLTAEEHELRELFCYRGQAIFDGHLDLDRLVEFRASPGAIRGRSGGMTGE